jgi:Barstar (barnase inhibitor)
VPVISIPSARITDWETFHDVFAELLGFPDFYGRNMNAWNDCLMYADKDDGMRSLVVPQGDVLTFAIEDVSDFAARCPEPEATRASARSSRSRSTGTDRDAHSPLGIACRRAREGHPPPRNI